MVRGLIVAVVLAVSVNAQQTVVAEGYHVIHPDGTMATATASTDKTEKVGAKKPVAKKKHGIRSLKVGK